MYYTHDIMGQHNLMSTKIFFIYMPTQSQLTYVFVCVRVCVCVCVCVCRLDGFHLTLPALKVHLDSCLQSPSRCRCGNRARPNQYALSINKLNSRQIDWILSYRGRTQAKPGMKNNHTHRLACPLSATLTHSYTHRSTWSSSSTRSSSSLV